MIKRLLIPATFTTALAPFVFAGCGGSSNNPTDAGNGASSDSSSHTPSSDGGTPGDGGIGSSDDGAQGNPPLPDGSILPNGNQLVADPNAVGLLLNGVTSDDYAIYTDPSSNTAFAISLTAGSKPISLGTVDPSDPVTVIGKVVFLGTSAPDEVGVGAASIWTSAATAPSPLSTSTFVTGFGQSGLSGLFAVSADGSSVAFVDGIGGNDATGSIAVAAISATGPTGKTVVVASADVADCVPEIALAGTTTKYLVASYCEVGDAGGIDAGEPDGAANLNLGTVSTFVAPSWTQAILASNVQLGFAVDQGGTEVVVNGPLGTQAIPIAGGTTVSIDTSGAVGALTLNPGVLTSNGASLIYTTTAEALKSGSTKTAGSPTTLAISGFTDVLALSPDQNWVVGGAFQQGQVTLALASATAAGTDGGATPLSSQAVWPLQGDSFTVDSSHVLFPTAAGALSAAKVTAPGTATVLGANVLLYFGTSAGKVVFNVLNANANDSADLLGVDTSGSEVPTVLVTAADQTFFLSSGKNLIVYTWSYQPGSSAGLWTLATP